MIKAIIFDLGGVLITNGTKSVAQHLAAKHNLAFDNVYHALNYSAYGNAYREGKISRDKFYDSLKKELGIEDDANELEQRWIEFYQLIERTKTIVDKLRGRYKVYFLSDNIKERVIAIDKKYEFIKWFHGGIFSHEVGVRKPNLKIYELTIEKIGFKPEEMLFIDDKEINLPPAEKLGIQTILFKDPTQLENELRKMKLL